MLIYKEDDDGMDDINKDELVKWRWVITEDPSMHYSQLTSHQLKLIND